MPINNICQLAKIILQNKSRSFDITNSKSEKLKELNLEVKFDHKLSFDEKILEVCKKASRKIHALSRVVSYINISKGRALMNAFVKSKFSYLPLVWMCHSRANNGKITRLHERYLRIIYSNKQSPFETLLEKDSSVSVHNQNLQILATEMYKINDLSHSIVTEPFEHKKGQFYNLRMNSHFTIPSIRTAYHGRKGMSFRGPHIWNILLDRLKKVNSIEAFKMQIKKLKSENFPCWLCKVYVLNVGFV